MPATGVAASLSEGEHEEIRVVTDRACGLSAVIAIHDSSPGVALGGLRCRVYEDLEQAIADALRLSRAMTYKCALASIPAGGAKIVVWQRPELRRAAAFQSLGRRVEEYRGRLFTSRDLGTGDDDLRALRQGTRYAVDPDSAEARDLGERTAEGVFLAAETCLDVLGIDTWGGLKVAIQGLGEVGYRLALRAQRAGAQVVGCDLDATHIGRAQDAQPIEIVDPERIYEIECDVFSPCAVGGVLDARNVDRLRCKAVVGAANNQLADEDCGDRLFQRGICYVPDFVANAGAVICGCAPALPGARALPGLDQIVRNVRELIVESQRRDVAPHRVANGLAEMRLAERRGQSARAGS